MDTGPKITVIGAGSYFFGRCVIHKIATSPALAGGTLALVDTNPRVLHTMARLAKRIFKATKCGVKIIAATDHRTAMRDSDFVILTFSKRNAYYRGVETDIAARHGIKMCSSDTIGPGGIFHALRELPHIIAMAKDAARLAPNAWVINMVNPSAVMGMGLRRYAPEVRSFALCDGHHEPHHTLYWCKELGILPKSATSVPNRVWHKLDIRISGVNHTTWMVRFQFDGKDLMPALRRKIAAHAKAEETEPREHSKARYNYTYALKLLDLYGAYPTAVGHTKEYVPFFQGYGVRPVEPEPITLFDADRRAQEMADAWKITEQYASGQRRASEFLKTVRDDHASDIIEGMWGNLRKPFYINTVNRGAVTNLPADAFLELRCDVDMRGPRPQPFGAFPRGLLAHQNQILDAHELTAEAAITGDRATLRRAMLTDPISNHNIGDADACIVELLEAERAVLPAYWFKRGRK